MKVSRGLRRRVDYQILRWQARLDGAWADRVLPWVGAAGLSLVLAAFSLARARSVETGAVMAKWVQGAWLISRGHSPDLTVTGSNLLEAQAPIGFYLVAPLTRLVAPIPLLLVLQAVALGLAVIPIWWLCRRICSLRVGAAAAAVVAYALYPPLHQLNLADFHPEALAVPLLLGGAYAGLRGRWWRCGLMLVAAVALRSDLGLTVAALGVLFAIHQHDPRAYRVVLAGLGWSLVMALGVQPLFGDGGFVHAEAFERYGSSAHGVLWGMISDPLAVLADVLARENYRIVVALLAPLALLPVLAPRYLLPVAPVLALTFLADVPVAGAEGAARLIPAMVFLFLALPFALARLGRRNIERVTVDGRLLGALTLAAAMFFVLSSPSSPYERPWEWGGRSLAAQARLEAAGLVGEELRVRTSPELLAELAGRRELHPVEDDRDLGGAQLTAGVDAVIIDEQLRAEWSPTRHEGVVRAVEAQGFELVMDRAGVQLFLRVSSP